MSIASQGLVSAANFSLSLALLYFAPTSDYVTFLLFVTVFALLSSLQNAIFISPIGVLVPRMANQLVARTESVTSRFAVVLAAVGIPFVLYSIPGKFALWETLGSALLYLSLLTLLLRREVARNGCLVRGDLIRLLRFDAIYFVVVIASMAFLVVTERLTFTLAAISFALPAVLTTLSAPRWPSDRKICPENEIRSLDTAFWKEVTRSARWAIPGVLVTWLFSNGYWFLLKEAAGDTAVAELGASRLLFTPVGLLIQGWVVMFRPVAVSLNHEGKQAQLRREVYQQALFGCATVTVLTALAWLVVSLARSYLPASLRSSSTQSHLLIWGLYFAIQWSRSGLTVASLTTAAGFRHVFWVGLMGCLTFYFVLSIGLRIHPIESCMWGLVIAEIFMTITLLKRFREHTRAVKK
jgi:hypothetical protein